MRRVSVGTERRLCIRIRLEAGLGCQGRHCVVVRPVAVQRVGRKIVPLRLACRRQNPAERLISDVETVYTAHWIDIERAFAVRHIALNAYRA